MMKIRNILSHKLWVLTLFTLLFSCNSDKSDFNEATHKSFSIDYTIKELNTRSSATVDELKVENALLLFYESSSGDFISHALIETLQSDDNLKFELPEELKKGEVYSVLIAANLDKYFVGGYQAFIEKANSLSYDEAKQSLSLKLIDNERLAPNLPYVGVLFNKEGEQSDLTLPNTSNPTPNTKLDYRIEFSRIVSRIDLVNPLAADLVIKWAKIVNYRDQSNLFNSTIIGDVVNDKVNANGIGVIKPHDDINNGVLSAQYIREGLYAFSNAVSKVKPNDISSTAILIAAYYKGSNELTYYRVNVAYNQGSQLLKRNYVYTINLTKVNGLGSSDEESALNNETPEIEYEVGDDWSDDGSNLVTDEQGNYLSVSTQQVELASDKESSYLIKINTNDGASWGVSFKDSENPFNEKFEIKKLDNFGAFKVTTKEYNGGVLKRSDLVVNLLNTKLTKEVKLSQLSAINDNDPLLTVDNKTGTLERKLPAITHYLRLIVKTGHDQVNWQAKIVGDDYNMISLNEQSGANNQYLTINYKANALSAMRNAHVLVSREGAEDVLIDLNQYEYSNNIITNPILPPNGSTIIIEGYEPAIKTGFMTNESFVVDHTPFDALYKPTNNNFSFNVSTHFAAPIDVTQQKGEKLAYKYTVGNNLNEEFVVHISSDLDPLNEFVISNDLLIGNIKNHWLRYDKTSPSHPITIYEKGESFYFKYFYTGPGDPVIEGNLRIKLFANSFTDENIKKMQELNYTIRIVTSARKGMPIIGKDKFRFQLADRNIGAKRANGYVGSYGPYHPSYQVDLVADSYIGDNMAKVTSNLEMIKACQEFAKSAGLESSDDNSWTFFTPVSPIYLTNRRIFNRVYAKTRSQSKIFNNLLTQHMFVSKGRLYFTSSPDEKVHGEFVGAYIPESIASRVIGDQYVYHLGFFSDSYSYIFGGPVDVYNPFSMYFKTVKTPPYNFNIRCMKYIPK